MNIQLYREEFKNEWNNFLTSSKNSSFLFDRNFVEYHSDRFKDYSLIIKEDDSKIIALLPANITQDNELVSHQGLTYGGFVVPHDIKLLTAIKVFYYALKFLNENKIDVFNFKCFPHFYNCSSTDEFEYILFLINASLYRRDVAIVIDQLNRIPYNGNIRRDGIKAEKQGAYIENDDSFDEFWEKILTPNLRERFGVNPVHTLDEISLLKSYFPENIKQHNVFLGGEIVGGVTVFIINQVVHCQYISANELGRKTGCLNFLFKFLVDEAYSSFRYFDFGIVNESEGRFINDGMLFWKESFGGRAQKQDFYKIDTSSFKLLEKYLFK